MRVIVLGSAAGGGVPQWNCRCRICALAWRGDPCVLRRTQSSLAVSADGQSWLLLNASPDLRQQILATQALHPRHGARHTPIAGVLVTNGDVDHIAGLLTLRERQAFTLFGAPAILDVIDRNAIFGVLDAERVPRRSIEIDCPLEVLPGLVVTPFLLPGKVPLFLEDSAADVAALSGMTIGLDMTCGGRRLVHAPGCASIPADLVRRLSGADVVLFDGTTFTDDEMPKQGLSDKTAARMGHVAISGSEGSLVRLAGLAAERKIFIHINNTNPILIEGSPERQTVEAAGWEIAYDGMEIAL